MFFSHGRHDYVALCRYGVVVFINIESLEQQHLIDLTLRPYLVEPIEGGEEEGIEVMIAPDQDERVHGEKITFREKSIPRLQILAEVKPR